MVRFMQRPELDQNLDRIEPEFGPNEIEDSCGPQKNILFRFGPNPKKTDSDPRTGIQFLQ